MNTIEVYYDSVLIHCPHYIFKHLDNNKIALFHSPSFTQEEWLGYITQEKKEQYIKERNLVKVDYFPRTMNDELRKLVDEVNE